MPSFHPTLAAGQTSGGVNVVWRVGADGSLNGTTTGPTIDVGPKPPNLFYGRTAGGVNVPILVNSSGIVQTTT